MERKEKEKILRKVLSENTKDLSKIYAVVDQYLRTIENLKLSLINSSVRIAYDEETKDFYVDISTSYMIQYAKEKGYRFIPRNTEMFTNGGYKVQLTVVNTSEEDEDREDIVITVTPLINIQNVEMMAIRKAIQIYFPELVPPVKHDFVMGNMMRYYNLNSDVLGEIPVNIKDAMEKLWK